MSAEPEISRREWLFGPLQRLAAQFNNSPSGMAAVAVAETKSAAKPESVAVVQGRFCLAFRGLACSTCIERCPVSGAMELERNIPRVNASLCTGCNICHDVCPAPRNAILLVPLKASFAGKN